MLFDIPIVIKRNLTKNLEKLYGEKARNVLIDIEKLLNKYYPLIKDRFQK
jgi:hypothetical protein